MKIKLLKFLQKQLFSDLEIVLDRIVKIKEEVKTHSDENKLYFATIILPDGSERTPNYYIFKNQNAGEVLTRNSLRQEKIKYRSYKIKEIEFVKKVVLKKKLKMDTTKDFCILDSNPVLVNKVEQNPNDSLICMSRFAYTSKYMIGMFFLAFLTTPDVDKAVEMIELGIYTSIPIRTIYFYKPTGKVRNFV